MIPRFQHILLPVDFTPKNIAALDIALEMAVQYGSRISLLHVIERVHLPDDDELRALYAHLEVKAHLEMSEMAARFAIHQIPVSQHVTFGPRADEIVRFADEHAADLILMSSHKVDPNRLVKSWSTVSYHVSLLCSCPVLLVK